MDSESRVEIERQGLTLDKTMVLAWGTVATAAMPTYQLLIWVTCQSRPRDSLTNIKCQEMKVRVVLTSVKTR